MSTNIPVVGVPAQATSQSTGYSYGQSQGQSTSQSAGASASQNTAQAANAAVSQGTGYTQSTSGAVSTPEVVQSPQALLDAQIAAAAQALGQQQEAWGQSVFANTSAVTGQSIDNFLTASQADMGMANQAINQYNTTTAPEITQQANMAAQYTSPSRIGINMGAAESQSEQSSQAALAAAKQNLQSYGINPSSGEYAELNAANRTSAGAAAAGAGQQAELATEATGRQLLASSIATGQQLPGQAINATNAGVGANTAAANASLANANTGVALTDTGPSSLLTTMAPIPSTANASTSTSQSTGYNQNTSASQGESASQGTSASAQQAAAQSTNEATNVSQNQSTSQTPIYPPASNSSGSMGQNGMGGYNPIQTAANIGGFGYSAGGDIGSDSDATQGGYVPRQASPSGGINVDDVPANLNAEEFVIPRDVARWKGEEFWHKEIAKSRAARVKAMQTVGPTAGSPQAAGQQPTFTSQAFSGGGI